MKQSLLPGLIGFILAIGVIKLSEIHLSNNEVNFQLPSLEKLYVPKCSLLGDIGGTNIRLQLGLVQPRLSEPIFTYKKEKLKVSEFQNLKDALQKFLKDAPCHPQFAVLAIAGPINDNSVRMGNVPKWGTISGFNLGKELNIKSFRFINDFQAVSYGILLLTNDDIVQLNGKKVTDTKTRGVMGPGTGLGHSIVYTNPTHFLKRAYVLPSQGGNSDFSFLGLDDQTTQFYTYLRKKMSINYVSVQRVCSGPTIPYIYQFYAQKHPYLQGSGLKPSSEQIVQMVTETNQQNSLALMTINLFIKFYGNAIGNFMVHHMPVGGVYLVGGLTQSILPHIQKIDILHQFKERHPQMKKILQGIPLVFPKWIDLGLKGAFVYARRVITDKQQE